MIDVLRWAVRRTPRAQLSNTLAATERIRADATLPARRPRGQPSGWTTADSAYRCGMIAGKSAPFCKRFFAHGRNSAYLAWTSSATRTTAGNAGTCARRTHSAARHSPGPAFAGVLLSEPEHVGVVQETVFRKLHSHRLSSRVRRNHHIPPPGTNAVEDRPLIPSLVVEGNARVVSPLLFGSSVSSQSTQPCRSNGQKPRSHFSNRLFSSFKPSKVAIETRNISLALWRQKRSFAKDGYGGHRLPLA